MNLTKLEKVLKNQIKLSKNEKSSLINFIDYIPMYDIYSNQLHLVNKSQLYDKMIHSHYRFVDKQLFDWLNNKYKKLFKKKNLNFDETQNLKNLKKNIKFLENYDIAKINKKSIEILYNFSPEVGLDITICKRKSFIPYFEHLKPYYSKDELINLGFNMGKIKKINKDVLVDPEIHYKICKKISKNDITAAKLLEDCVYIKNNDAKNLIKYYSLYGSYFINKSLRSILGKNGKLDKKKKLNNSMLLSFANQLINTIKNSPPLDQDYIVYRFITDDSYLRNLKVGSLFTETGIMSTTRDPFYSNDNNDAFGFILMKIKLPKNIKGLALNIECYSYFPYEQELILPPLARFKLISKNDNFNYYHIDKNFQKKIKKKYEFEFHDFLPIPNFQTILNPISKKYLDLMKIELNGNTYIEKANYFVENYTNSINELYIKIDNEEYRINTIWYDSTGPYKKFYYFETNTGFSLTIYNKTARVILFIEINTEISVNYFMKWNSSFDGKEIIDDENLIELVTKLAYSFKIPEILIHFNYCSFDYFSSNYNSMIEKDILDCFSFPIDFYNYFTKNIKRFRNIPTMKTGFNYFQLDKLKKMKSSDINDINLKDFLKENNKKSLSELFVLIIEEKFYFYNSFLENINTIFEAESNPFNYMYYSLNAYKYLFDKNIIKSIPNIEKTLQIKKNIIDSFDYKELFKSRFRLTD
ncbi:hypothetical protein CPAV1605_118 [seawater metagenome]|uniref:ADP ribosyltransferase domain-containing protein n=1 Tax=seawater metagenome TaxID=1561972 RepID=A0A5E8CH85_9ZZZZ